MTISDHLIDFNGVSEQVNAFKEHATNNKYLNQICFFFCDG